MVLRVGDEEVVSKLWDAMHHCMDSDDTFYAIDVTDDYVFEFV